MRIDELPAPENSLIYPYTIAEGHYTDAFQTDAPTGADLPCLIEAFYTSPVFKAERLVLALSGARSTDEQASDLARDGAQKFAIWQVEARGADEILMDAGRTKSWLMVRGGHLWFGSVVVPVMQRGKLTLGPVFYSLLQAHKVYSRVLLGAAARRLARQ